MTKWSDDPTRVQLVCKAIDEVYEGPWGLKASPRDVVSAVTKALYMSLDYESEGTVADRLWEWQCEQPSPLTQGLVSMVEDGLQPGTTVPLAEVAGDGETQEWAQAQARFIIDVIQDVS